MKEQIDTGQLSLLIPDFINEEVLIKPKYSIGRVQLTSGRHYFVTDKESPVEDEMLLLPSVTTIISATSPLSHFIIDKMIEMGKDAWNKYLKERQDYGTNMHILISEFVISKKISLPLSEAEIVSICTRNKGFNLSIYEKFKDELIQDLLAFAQFVSDYNAKIIAVELPLADKELGYGGTLDLCAFITIKDKGYFGEVYKSGPRKGQMKETWKETEVLALIDHKSGRSGFYRSNEVQLQMCRDLFFVNYPDIAKSNDVRCYNWSPKAWIKTPSYNFTDQTDKATSTGIKHRVGLFKEENESKFINIKYFEGDIIFGESPEEVVKTRFSYE